MKIDDARREAKAIYDASNRETRPALLKRREEELQSAYHDLMSGDADAPALLFAWLEPLIKSYAKHKAKGKAPDEAAQLIDDLHSELSLKLATWFRKPTRVDDPKKLVAFFMKKFANDGNDYLICKDDTIHVPATTRRRRKEQQKEAIENGDLEKAEKLKLPQAKGLAARDWGGVDTDGGVEYDITGKPPGNCETNYIGELRLRKAILAHCTDEIDRRLLAIRSAIPWITQAQIAKQLGKSQQTVSRRLSLLKAEYKEVIDEPEPTAEPIPAADKPAKAAHSSLAAYRKAKAAPAEPVPSGKVPAPHVSFTPAVRERVFTEG